MAILFPLVPSGMFMTVAGYSLQRLKRCEITFAMRSAIALPQAGELNTACGVVKAWLLASFKNTYSTDFVIDTIEGRSLAQDPPPIAQLTVAIPGTVANDPLPPQSTMLAKFKTGIGGKSYRGHIHLFYPSETEQSNGKWDSLFMATCLASVQGLVSACITAGTPLVIYSRHLVALNDITDVGVDPIVRSLRSREVDRGI